jgi:hypothetical protein
MKPKRDPGIGINELNCVNDLATLLPDDSGVLSSLPEYRPLHLMPA